MRLGIVGCGVIGQRRSQFLPPGTQVTACFDPSAERAGKLAQALGARAFSSLDELLAAKAVDAVVVATTNAACVPTVQRCVDAGVHVLVEKPAARSAKELATLRVPKGVVVKVGFNHRFHPAYERLLKELAADPSDPVMYLTARYGNGARVGFEKEWRADVAQSGGGELLDQGVHVLDLAARILPDLEVKTAWVRTQYWAMPVDDNAWAILGTKAGQTFAFHVSSSEWKNEFRFEVYTRKKKLTWAGLGRSYGPESLTLYKMLPQMGPPEVERFEFSGEDQSWLLENQNFAAAIEGRQPVDGGLADAARVLGLVEGIYTRSAALAHDRPHPEWWRGA